MYAKDELIRQSAVLQDESTLPHES